MRNGSPTPPDPETGVWLTGVQGVCRDASSGYLGRAIESASGRQEGAAGAKVTAKELQGLVGLVCDLAVEIAGDDDPGQRPRGRDLGLAAGAQHPWRRGQERDEHEHRAGLEGKEDPRHAMPPGTLGPRRPMPHRAEYIGRQKTDGHHGARSVRNSPSARAAPSGTSSRTRLAAAS